MDQNEPSVVHVTEAFEDLEECFPAKQFAPFKKLAMTNVGKYNDLRVKLKETDHILTQEIADSEKFIELVSVLEVRARKADSMLKDVKALGKNPDSLESALDKVKEIVMIIEEIYEIVPAIEKITVLLNNRCKNDSKALKAIDTKTSEVKATKKKMDSLLKATKDEEDKILKFQQNSKDLEDHLQDISQWLPSVEAEIVKTTPLSALWVILKKQYDETAVSAKNFFKI